MTFLRSESSRLFLSVLLTGIYLFPAAIRGVDIHHDGLMLKTAWDIASGQTLFRDTFTQYGPLTSYAHAASLLLFGKSLLSLRLVTWLAYILSAALLVRLWGKFLSPNWVWTSFLLWLFLSPEVEKSWTFLPWSSAIALPLQIATALFWIGAHAEKKSSLFSMNGFLTGITCASVFWARTPVGVFLALALALGEGYFFYRRRNLSRFLSILAGFLGLHLIFVSFLASNGTLSEWYFQCIVIPSQWAASQGQTVARVIQSLFVLGTDALEPWPIVRRFLSLAFFGVTLFSPLLIARRKVSLRLSVLSFVLAAALAWETFRTGRGWGFWLPWIWIVGAWPALKQSWLGEKSIAVICLTFVVLASWLQYYPITCPRHIFWAASPGVGLALYFLKNWAGKNPGALALGLFLTLTPLGISRGVQLGQKIRFLNSAAYPGPITGLRVSSDESLRFDHAYEGFQKILALQPSAPILLTGSEAFFGVWVNETRNYRPIFIHWEGIPLTPADKEKRDHYIRRFRPLLLAPHGLPLNPEFSAYGYTLALELGSEWGSIWQIK